MVSSKCEHCGKETNYKYKGWVRKYCSHKCANVASSTQRTIPRQSISCHFCNKEFYLLESVIRSRTKQVGTAPQYCSKKCEGMSKRTRKVVNCKQCNKEFETTRNLFCSRICRDEYFKINGMKKKSGYWFENGYKILYVNGNKSIKEHIKIMENAIGRKLEKDEVVHHINSNIGDNRIENLALMTRSEHSRLHRNIEIANGKQLFKESIQN